MRLWDVDSRKERATLTGHDKTDTGDTVFGLAFSPNGRLLAASAGEDRTVRLWDVASGKQRAIFTGHTDDVKDVAFSPNGQLLASRIRQGFDDNTARLWKVPS